MWQSYIKIKGYSITYNTILIAYRFARSAVSLNVLLRVRLTHGTGLLFVTFLGEN